MAKLLEEAEFQEIRLTDWLGRPDGRLIETAVLAVLPPWEAAEARLLIAAIAAAAAEKRQGQVVAAITTATIGVLVLLFVAMVLRSPTRGR